MAWLWRLIWICPRRQIWLIEGGIESWTLRWWNTDRWRAAVIYASYHLRRQIQGFSTLSRCFICPIVTTVDCAVIYLPTEIMCLYEVQTCGWYHSQSLGAFQVVMETRKQQSPDLCWEDNDGVLDNCTSHWCCEALGVSSVHSQTTFVGFIWTLAWTVNLSLVMTW